jgi:acyl-coenzyme A synthetase/AMP-(fatty) acid ligase/thioredoxin reductase
MSAHTANGSVAAMTHRAGRVCVIGAGAAGIAMCRALELRGIPYDCYERRAELGGLWRYPAASGTSCAYESLCANTSKTVMQYPSYPMPDDYPHYPHHTQVARYFDDYVDHHGVRPHIQLQTEVTAVKPASGGGWTVRLGDGSAHAYRAVMVASGGRHGAPVYARIGGSFAGRVLHALDYDGPAPFAGQRVVIVGLGATSADIATEVSRVAAATYLSARTGHYVVPKIIEGRPIDKLSPFMKKLSVEQRRPLLWLMLKLVHGDMTAYGLPAPPYKPGQGPLISTSELLPAIVHGRISPKPVIESAEGLTVRFADGQAVEADAVIHCTGYRIEFPFLDDTLVSGGDDAPPLYHLVVAPELPNLYFIGLLHSMMSLMPLAEAQSEWVGDLLDGSVRLPSRAEMWAEIRRARRRQDKRFWDSSGHLLVDPDEYVPVMASERVERATADRGGARRQTSRCDNRAEGTTGVISSDPTMRPITAAPARRIGPVKLFRGQFHRERVSLRKPVNAGVMAELAAERFGRSVPIHLDRPFAWDPDRRLQLDYVELANLVEQMSAVLKAAGVGKWDRVAIVKTPNYDSQTLAWAAARIGAIPALLSARLDPDILNILLDRLGAKVVVTDPEVAAYAGLDKARLRALSCTAIADAADGIPVADLWGGPVPAPSPLKDDEPMLITHTSSTTGVSKLGEASAASVTFAALRESIFPFVHNPDELFASVISHVHVRAAVTQMASLSRGTPILGIGNPDDETIVRLFSRFRPTIVEAHPNAFMGWEQLADHPSRPFGSLRVFFNTFDAIHPRTVRRMLASSDRAFPVWLQCYGMTETSVVSVRGYTRRSAERLGSRDSRSVGWEVPGVYARIADPQSGRRRRNQHEAGMIQVKTPGRVLSFVGTPDKFSERRHGKWFDTGDWGRRGRWHQLEVLDRVADRIEGVESCLLIEDMLLDRIPDAEEVVVVPDEHGKPAAVVCMRDGKPLSDEAWRAASADIGGLGSPVVVAPDELQRTATAKSRRYLLSERIKSANNGRSDPIRPEILLRDGA